ncbi:MAG: HypC/HybG/HupF family hydrogenase formation chaperone [Chlamydiae bacterium]|nr:HypC/HybG/HupF family hydrogenase formation chaperone [Chlamydiota bacterium]
MCLALPGKIIGIDSMRELPMADVDFGGVIQRVCLAYTPDAEIGDFILVHVGFSLRILDAQQVQSTLDLIEEL